MKVLKDIRFLAMALFLLVLLAACSMGGGSSVLNQPIGKMKFDPPQPEEWKLDNGLTVLFLQDDELPLVYGELLIPGGSYWEPKNLPGVVSVMGGQMREGGAGSYSANQLDQRLEELSAGVGASFGGEYGTVSFSSLSSDVDEVFSIFGDVVLRPRFEEGRLQLAQGQLLESIRRRKDDPTTIVGVAFRELVFGDSPWGKVLSSDDVRKMSRIDLLRMHRYFVRPNGAYLVITGDITKEKAESLVEKQFANWQARKEELPEPPQLNFTPTPGIYFLEFPFQQATIAMGHQGVARLSKDYIEINAFNEIFGTSGFSSKLMQDVREKKGLVYSIGGYISPGFVTGTNFISMQTKSETADEALVASLEVLKNLQEKDIPEVELEEFKQTIENARVFKFVSPYQVAERTAILRLQNYPADYDKTFLPKTEMLTPEQIRATANRRWDLSKFVIVIVGNETAFEKIKELEASGPDYLRNFQVHRARFDERINLG